MLGPSSDTLGTRGLLSALYPLASIYNSYLQCLKSKVVAVLTLRAKHRRILEYHDNAACHETFFRSVLTSRLSKEKSDHSTYSSSSPAARLAARFLATRPGGPCPYGEFVAKSMCFSEAVRTLKEGTLTSWLPTRM